MDERTPPGERDVFNLISTGPDDLVALHSLDLAPWNRNLRTELDFVVLFPDSGILCIEVKSQEDISFDGSRWYPQSIVRSPFKQASDGRHTLYRRLAALAPQFKRVPIVHCCIFPRAEFHVFQNLSVASWELMDRRVFHGFLEGRAFCADLKARMLKSIAVDDKVAPLRKVLSAEEIEEFIGFCLPVQKRRPGAREEIQRREEEIERILREQQKPVLQLSLLNDKLIVSGAAGTGKTLIALEVARRVAENGKRVAILCYNALIGDWMSQQVQRMTPVLPNLVAGRAIRVMAEMAGIEIPVNPNADYWESELPQQLEDRLTDPEFKASAGFDYLVLDEAQDLLARPQLWDCLQLFVRDGLEHGAFALFGDFEYQILSEREIMIAALARLQAETRPVRWNINENCRNYRIVGETAVTLAGIGKQVYSGYRRSGGSHQNFEISFYENDQAQLDTLTKWIRDLKDQGFRPSDITLLSFRADQFSAASRLQTSGYKLRPVWQSGNLPGYSSIHAFKGMESKVVVLTDVVLAEGHGFHRDLFYIGMTRAIEVIRVLCSETSKGVLSAWLSEKANS